MLEIDDKSALMRKRKEKFLYIDFFNACSLFVYSPLSPFLFRLEFCVIIIETSNRSRIPNLSETRDFIIRCTFFSGDANCMYSERPMLELTHG
jgi:hypothetical protein